MDKIEHELKMRKYFPYAAGVFAFLFLILMAMVKYSPASVAGMDQFAHGLVLPLQTIAGSRIALLVSVFGSTAGIIVGLIAITGVFCHRPDIVTRVWIALLGSTVSGAYLKDWVHRARPDTLPWLQPITNSFSFPSGHANASTVFYGFLALLLFVHAPTKLRKTLALVIPGIGILLIGFSRIALNYHYASDVLGGFLLGGFWLTFSLSFPLYYELYHREAAKLVVHSEPIIRPVL
jgi:undecaprenyl-diphosphatase